MDIEKSINVSELAIHLLRFSFVLGVAFGVILVIIYCGGLDYYPEGLTIGDALFFISAGLSFGVVYVLVAGAILCAGITISPIFRITLKFGLLLYRIATKNSVKTGKDKASSCGVNFQKLGWDYTGFLIVGIFVLFLNITLYGQDFEKAFGLTLAIACSGFLFGLWFTKPNESIGNPEQKKKAGLAVAFILCPLIVTRPQGSMLDQSMNQIGVRAENVQVQIDKKYAQFFENAGISPDRTIETDMFFEGATMLFRGIGVKTVIEVDGLILYVANDDIAIARVTK